MKKYIGTLIAGVTLMAGFPVVGHAADQKTTADVSLTQDELNKDVTLDQAPSVDFGSNVRDNGTVTYSAKSITDAIKVTNPGNTDGWQVSVSRTGFTTTDAQALKGELLKFGTAAVTPDDDQNASTRPTAHEITINNAPQAILTANAKEGIGKFTATHANDQITLVVPAGNVAGAYKSTLTWTLANTPEA
ncbi:WxL domain-containing protein [Lactiplantibacillus modestisalitolerans]|uniref:WxL domain-containing protein n=1 Tax=Lactiplantibacillus modestisalitolerans TaxID=1457219 RepID=A0ABV5WS82_9LACO|nr:WxL domain-containing protein [Lactiplantibacillus modestisalitolerans]